MGIEPNMDDRCTRYDDPQGRSGENVSRTIRMEQEYNYCPICGAEVTKKEVPITAVRTNIEVECPEHGTLIHD